MTPASSWPRPRPPRGRRGTPWSRCSRSPRRSCPRIPTSSSTCPPSAATAPAARPTRAPCSSRWSIRASARPPTSASRRSPNACLASRGSPSISRTRPASASAGARRRRSTSTRCRAATSTSSTPPHSSWSPTLRKLKTVTDVTTDLLNTNPTVLVQIDRQRAATLGITPAVLENTLAEAYNEQQASTIYTATNEYWVVMEVLPSAQTDITDLENLYVHTSTGKVTPLSNIATLVRTTTPTTVNHSGQVPSVTVSFNIPPNGNLGAVVTQVDADRPPGAARDDHVRFLGPGTGVPELGEQSRRPAPRHGVRDLHHPGHSLRELRPPDHDSHRTALRHVRRAARALRHARRARCLRLRRDHHADRHCEEERDHDDRLRDRRGARAAARRPRRRSCRRRACGSARS